MLRVSCEFILDLLDLPRLGLHRDLGSVWSHFEIDPIMHQRQGLILLFLRLIA